MYKIEKKKNWIRNNPIPQYHGYALVKNTSKTRVV